MRSLVVTVVLLLASLVFAMATQPRCATFLAADHPVWKFAGKAAERGTISRCVARKGEPVHPLTEPAVTLDDRTEMIEQHFGQPIIAAAPSEFPPAPRLSYTSTWPSRLLRPPQPVRA